MKILIIGAGVLGSLYAVRLKQSGVDITLLARNRRFNEINKQGILLEDTVTGKRQSSQVPLVRSLESGDAYDLIIVLVRRDQVDALLPILAANRRSKTVLFMVNNPNGYDNWINAVGRDRLILGFAGAGGTRVDGVVSYHILSPLLQPTTLAELDGSTSIRIKSIAEVLKLAGFPVAICKNMEAWQKIHVAWVSPLANALYAAGGDGKKLSSRSDLLDAVVEGIREGFKVLHQLGVPVAPPKMKLIEILPKYIIRTMLKLWSRSKHFDTIATRHTLAAYNEMKMLSEDFQTIARSTTLSTPALDCLHKIMIASKSKFVKTNQ